MNNRSTSSSDHRIAGHQRIAMRVEDLDEETLELIRTVEPGPESELVEARLKQSETAISLMRMALALLDAAGETAGVARLQHAIDTVTGVPIPPPNRLGEQVADRA